MEFKKFIKASALKDKIKFVKRMLMQIFSKEGAISEGKAAKEDTLVFWNDKKFISWLKSLGVDATQGKTPEYKDGGGGRGWGGTRYCLLRSVIVPRAGLLRLWCVLFPWHLLRHYCFFQFALLAGSPPMNM
jgi:hypothetical protein